jgi:hypothetical protein
MRPQAASSFATVSWPSMSVATFTGTTKEPFLDDEMPMVLCCCAAAVPELDR